jgi:cytidylate kinase
VKKNYIIAIDGPAASGKSTTAKLLAKKLKYVYIDTGAMYRACALDALKNNVSLKDHENLKKLIDKINIEIVYSENGNKILLNGEDVTQRIREADISKLSSEIAVIGFVRDKMVQLQREMGKKGGIIMDGRDIGTVVFPNADFKFFMIADVEHRAERRLKELLEKGKKADFETVKNELIWRDKNDSSRKHSPLKKADDAIEIDTSNMTIEEQVEKIYKIIKEGKN